VSRENVEIVDRYHRQLVANVEAHWEKPRSYAAELERGESDPGSRSILEMMHPDIRWISVAGEISEGKLGCARYADELLGASQSYSLTLCTVTDLGGDQVLTEHVVQMRGVSSGVEGRIEVFTVYTLRDGLIAEVVEYISRAEALRAEGPEK
jgi:hypothetical protein